MVGVVMRDIRRSPKAGRAAPVADIAGAVPLSVLLAEVYIQNVTVVATRRSGKTGDGRHMVGRMPRSGNGTATGAAARMKDTNLGGKEDGRNRFPTRTGRAQTTVWLHNIRPVNMTGSLGEHFRDTTSLVAERTQNTVRNSCSLRYVAECSTDRRNMECSAATFDDGPASRREDSRDCRSVHLE